MPIVIAALHRPTKPTGVCRYAVNLCNCLAGLADITKVTLLIGKWQHQYFQNSFKFTSNKIQLLNIDIQNSSTNRNLWFLFGLPKLSHQLKPDLLHLSFPLPFIRSLFKSPVVSTIHDLYPYECPNNFGYPSVFFNRWFLRQSIRNSDGLACVSRTTLSQLNHYFPNNRANKNVVVLYNYVSFGGIEAKSPELQSFELDNNSFLLCVAQHRKNKNLDFLIKAYAYLLKQNKISACTQVLLVGSSGPETKNLMEIIQILKLQDRFHLLSSISDSELRWLYENCELFVIPSSVEGFRIPLAEATLLSCRIVCSDIPIFRELSFTDCTLFDLKTSPAENLAGAIAQALAQPKPEKGEHDARFSQATAANQCLSFYLQMLKSQNSILGD